MKHNRRRRAAALMLLLVAPLTLGACTAGRDTHAPPAIDEARQYAESIRTDLAADGAAIDYDTLLAVYHRLRTPPAPLPGMESLVSLLIDQRNADGRIDQMVLICAALVLGGSPHPIPGAEVLFGRILDQEDRISHWVLAFVAEAIGDYPADLPGGGALVGRVELWQARLDQDGSKGREYFGAHFLPPPKNPRIQAHIAGIADRQARQRERGAFYLLIANQVPEEAVAAAFDHLAAHGAPGTGEMPIEPLGWMVKNWARLPADIRQ